MSKRRNRSSTPDARSYRYSYSHDSVAGLQVIQYRSYQRDISIYHLHTDLLPLHMVRKALQSQPKYRDRLISYDPLRYSEVIEGDEIPSRCIEAAYMPNILRRNGSALALRAGGDLESEAVEWYVFSGPIDDFLSQIVCVDGKWSLQPNKSPGGPQKVFDLVGYAEKGLKTRTVRGANREHKGWHDALCASQPVKKKKVKLTWKKYGNELKADQERKSRGETVGPEGQEQDEDGDLSMRDESMQPPQPPQKPVTRRKAVS